MDKMRPFQSYDVVKLLILFCLIFAALPAAAGEHEEWLTNAAVYPKDFALTRINHDDSSSLRSDVIAGQWKCYWTPPNLDTNSSPRLMVSAEFPGHWPARDWRSHPMQLRGRHWEGTIPVEDLDVPVIYFLQWKTAVTNHISPIRISHPQKAGMEIPTRLFWPFIEGFEEGSDGWQVLGTASGQITTSSESKTGKGALQLNLPGNKRSVVAGTTRIRGWKASRRGAKGISFWIKSSSGPGLVRMTLQSHAFTSNQTIFASTIAAPVTDTWQKVEFPFSSFPDLKLEEVDWATFEVVGAPGISFFIDDLHYLGFNGPLNAF